MVAMMRKVGGVHIALSGPDQHLNVCEVTAKRCVNTEMNVVFVELVVAVLDEQTVQAAALCFEFINAIYVDAPIKLFLAYFVGFHK